MSASEDSELELACSDDSEGASDINDEDVDEDRELEDAQTQADRREANIQALLDNKLSVQRAPVMSKLNLSIEAVEKTLKRAFVSPMVGAPSASDDLRRRLAARKVFVPWGSNAPLKPQIPALPLLSEPPPAPALEAIELPEGIEPLIVYEPPEGTSGSPIRVDTMLTRWLRPHQREGVQFMFQCVTGQRVEGGQGCILADDMGLGKTLQAITLLWTLLTDGNDHLGGLPIAKRAIIVCPTSLVSNWESECEKWLCGRLKCLALCEASREDVVSSIASFLAPRQPAKVLIISYETFRIHATSLHTPSACDLLICDEAHRLKNDATLTNRALDALPCRRRVLLSGTPLQNDLAEFYAMVDFTNPGILGTAAAFRKNYEAPILAGREPDATPEVVERGSAQSAELSSLVNSFILRRTNALLSAHLPPKVVLVVCCRLSEMQQCLYQHFLASKATKKLIDAGKKGTAGVLSAITSLKKLCNHPKLIYDALNTANEKGKGQGGKSGEGELAAGFKGVGDLFPPGIFDGGRGRSVESWMSLGGKMAVLARLLHLLRTETKDRIVIVSNYTQTLDLIALLCRERNYPVLRLDGSTGMSKRQKLVKEFCDQGQNQFVFLLSSKAGGCGLNLVGGNRLVLFDPDWNPATDKQAAGRVWRDGQKKVCYVYRFLSTGTIEEKVFQRQISKEGLQSLVSKNGKATASVMSESELRELFQLQTDTLSNTFESMCQLEGQGGPEGEGGGNGEGKGEGGQIFKPQVGKPTEEDMQCWGHHSSMDTVPDLLLQRAACGGISFCFTCEVDGKLPDPPTSTLHGDRNPSTSMAPLPPKPPLPPPLPPPIAASSSRIHLPPPMGKENVVASCPPSVKRSMSHLPVHVPDPKRSKSEVIEIDSSDEDDDESLSASEGSMEESDEESQEFE